MSFTLASRRHRSPFVPATLALGKLIQHLRLDPLEAPSHTPFSTGQNKPVTKPKDTSSCSDTKGR